jgi:Uma2 family endonuclease
MSSMLQLRVPIPEGQQAVRLPAGAVDWSEEEFFHFCQANRDLRIERTPQGEIVVMSPAGGYSSYRSGEVFGQLRAWAEEDKTGLAFDSSGGFLLPNGAMRAPDAAWVRYSRLKPLTHYQKERFLPLAPDFVIEVASPSDELSELRAKMEEYRQAGVRLGWLILPESTSVEVYSEAGVQTLASPESLAGDQVLPGFRLELDAVWNPPF